MVDNSNCEALAPPHPLLMQIQDNLIPDAPLNHLRNNTERPHGRKARRRAVYRKGFTIVNGIGLISRCFRNTTVNFWWVRTWFTIQKKRPRCYDWKGCVPMTQTPWAAVPLRKAIPWDMQGMIHRFCLDAGAIEELMGCEDTGRFYDRGSDDNIAIKDLPMYDMGFEQGSL